MQDTIKYRGYTGSVEFSEEDKIFCGKVQGIHSVIIYEGETIEELIADFHSAVDDYLELCEQRGSEPEKPFDDDNALTDRKRRLMRLINRKCIR